VSVLQLNFIKLKIALNDCCGAPPLVCVELVASPFWLESVVVVDMLACCSFISTMLSKVACSTATMMVGRA
jgi:hypothetical protein